MQKYKDYAPTGFDKKGAFLPDQSEWLVIPCGRNRDSNSFQESNFHTALEMLGGEAELVQVHRFGHWACGWFEIIIVDPSLEDKAQEIEDSLEIYPLLDESDYSRRQREKAAEYYDRLSVRDKWRDYLKDKGYSVFAARHSLSKLLHDYDADAIYESLTRDD